MKLEIYEGGYVGYVSLNPYEWKYIGKYPETREQLSNFDGVEKYESYRTDSGEIVESEIEITDEEEALRKIGENLTTGGVWGTKIVDDG